MVYYPPFIRDGFSLELGFPRLLKLWNPEDGIIPLQMSEDQTV